MGTNFKNQGCILTGLFILVLQFSCFHVNAQNMYAGIKGGINIAHMNGDINHPTFMNKGNIGFLYTYDLKKDFGFTGEVLFTMKGSKYFDTLSLFTKRLNYIEVPLSCHYYIPLDMKDFKAKVFAGPSIGFLIYAHDKDQEVKSNYKKAELGLLGGAGFEKLVFKKYWLTFDIRYQHSLLNVSKINNYETSLGILSFNIGIFTLLPTGGEEKKKEEKK
jgi:hypothetical protein